MKTLRSIGVIMASALIAALAVNAIIMVFAGCWKILSAMVSSEQPLIAGIGLILFGAMLLSLVIFSIKTLGKTTRQGQK